MYYRIFRLFIVFLMTDDLMNQIVQIIQIKSSNWLKIVQIKCTQIQEIRKGKTNAQSNVYHSTLKSHF